jgi:hypothetical protein
VSEADPLPRSARRVRTALVELGLPADIHRLADSTRTAPEAAAAVGCELGAIVKSLVMRGTNTHTPVLALVSGDNRADMTLIEAVRDEPIERPDAGGGSGACRRDCLAARPGRCSAASLRTGAGRPTGNGLCPGRVISLASMTARGKRSSARRRCGH